MSKVADSTRRKMQSLLNAVVSTPAADETKIPAEKYDWRRPNYFNQQQLVILNDFADGVTSGFSRKLGEFMRCQYQVTLSSADQQYAEDFITPEITNYYLPIYSRKSSLANQKQKTTFSTLAGVICVPVETGKIWAKKLLGETRIDLNSDEEMAPLEQSLLADLIGKVAQVLTDCHPSKDFSCGEEFREIRPGIDIETACELYNITLHAKPSDSGDQNKDDVETLHVVMLCEELNAIVGKTDPNELNISPESIKRALTNIIKQVDIAVATEMSNTAITFEQLVDMKVNDIVLFDKKIDEPIDITVQSRPLFRGWMAKTQGNYAVVIENINQNLQ